MADSGSATLVSRLTCLKTQAWDVTRACVAYYKMNDDEGDTVVVDSSPGANDGVLQNGYTEDVSIEGKLNKAFNLNGSTQRVEVSYNSDTDLIEELSFAIWVYNHEEYPASEYGQAEDNIGAIGSSVIYNGRSCVLVEAGEGADYCFNWVPGSDHKASIYMYLGMLIKTKPETPVDLCRLELYDATAQQNVATAVVSTDDFEADEVEQWVSWELGKSIREFWPLDHNYVVKVYSFGNQDFYIDRVVLDKYHRSPGGKPYWNFWGSGNQFKCNTTDGTKTVSSAYPSLDVWMQIIGTFSKSNNRMRIYQNGVLKATTELSSNTSIIANSNTFYLGSKGGTVTEHFFGDSDNAQVFKRELSVVEALGLYNRGSGTEDLSGPLDFTCRAIILKEVLDNLVLRVTVVYAAGTSNLISRTMVRKETSSSLVSRIECLRNSLKNLINRLIIVYAENLSNLVSRVIVVPDTGDLEITLNSFVAESFSLNSIVNE